MSAHRAEINVTPLIDILLVVLVIFLAPLPLIEVAIDADVPAATQSEKKKCGDDQIVFEYSRDGRLAINNENVSLNGLQSRLRDISASRTNTTLFHLGRRRASLRSHYRRPRRRQEVKTEN